jgi:hypothetical protein
MDNLPSLLDDLPEEKPAELYLILGDNIGAYRSVIIYGPILIVRNCLEVILRLKGPVR